MLCFIKNLFIFSMRISLSSPVDNEPDLYSSSRFFNFLLLSSNKYFSQRKLTSISGLPPFSLCSFMVGWPPENAYFFILYSTVFSSSLKSIYDSGFDELIFVFGPCSPGINLWNVNAGREKLILDAMSLLKDA